MVRHGGIRVPKERRKLITADIVARMIDTAPTRQDKAVLVFYYIFGTRVSEAFTIEKSDMWIDGEWLYVKIKRSKEDSKTLFPRIDTLKVRTSTPFIQYLIAHWSSVKEGKLFRYGRYDVSTARGKVWKMVKGTNPDSWVHLFRHSRNEASRQKGYTRFQRAVWHGWKDPTTADKSYSHPSEKDIEDIGGDIE